MWRSYCRIAGKMLLSGGILCTILGLLVPNPGPFIEERQRLFITAGISLTFGGSAAILIGAVLWYLAGRNHKSS